MPREPMTKMPKQSLFYGTLCCEKVAKFAAIVWNNSGTIIAENTRLSVDITSYQLIATTQLLLYTTKFFDRRMTISDCEYG